jgi:hypothetical protein
MAQQIEIVSNAMILIGANPISSLTEGTEGLVASALYETSYSGLIASHSWRFATKQRQLSRLTEAPLKTYQYQYQLPSDVITIVRVIDGSDYELYMDKLYTNAPEVHIEYRFRVDETLLPDYFQLTLQFLLAAQFAIPITDNTQRAQLYEGLYERQLARAKFIDSSSRPNHAVTNPFAGIN